MNNLLSSIGLEFRGWVGLAVVSSFFSSLCPHRVALAEKEQTFQYRV
jgi:hypothetical protein